MALLHLATLGGPPKGREVCEKMRGESSLVGPHISNTRRVSFPSASRPNLLPKSHPSRRASEIKAASAMLF